jgi:hypothetical protein
MLALINEALFKSPLQEKQMSISSVERVQYGLIIKHTWMKSQFSEQWYVLIKNILRNLLAHYQTEFIEN